MAEYSLMFLPGVHRNSDPPQNIPEDIYNVDWIAYQEWLAAGNTPDPYVAPVVETAITSRQFWTQLAVIGKIDDTEAEDAMTGDLPNAIKHFINTTLPMPQRFAAKMFFLDRSFARHEVAVTHSKAIFSLSDAQMDQFFHDAALL